MLEVSVKLLDFENPSIFWNDYPQFKFKEPFASLYKKDKTKNKDYSSRIMWCFGLLYSKDSIYVNSTIDEKKQLIADEFMIGKTKFEWTGEVTAIKMSELDSTYVSLFVTPAQKSLFSWETKLKEIQNIFDDNEVTLDMGDADLKNMLILIDKLPKFYEIYEKTKKVVMEEQVSKNKGDVNVSASDEGLI